MVYCYRDKAGILHCHELERIAKEYAANGTNVVEWDGEAKGGYPQIAGYNVIDYGAGEVYVEGNRRDGKRVEGLSPRQKQAVLDELAKIGI